MDLSTILPLLMRSGANGDKTDLLTTLMPKNEKTDELMKLMSMMKPASNAPKPQGLKAVRNVAPDDILGAMLKYYERK